MRDYVRDGAEIYRRSFATIHAEADLAGLPSDVAQVVVRMVHACGMTDLVADTRFSPDAVAAGVAALRAGAPVLCDVSMAAAGVIRDRLPAANPVVSLVESAGVAEVATRLGTTRSAAGVEVWRERLGGAVVVVGNAPTALFRLLEVLDEGAEPPAVVVGVPVGFVGAAESKDALAAADGVPFVTVLGRRGGSAIAAAAVNAMAGIASAAEN